MLIAGIVIYLLLTLVIGFVAARRVKTVSDFALAGKRLSFFMASATVFATWFGSETILGSSAEFAKKGLSGVIEERYASYDGGLGARIESGQASLMELEDYVLRHGEPSRKSGKQELLENVLNRYLFR